VLLYISFRIPHKKKTGWHEDDLTADGQAPLAEARRLARETCVSAVAQARPH
jgi:hypothetical protein